MNSKIKIFIHHFHLWNYQEIINLESRNDQLNLENYFFLADFFIFKARIFLNLPGNFFICCLVTLSAKHLKIRVFINLCRGPSTFLGMLTYSSQGYQIISTLSLSRKSSWSWLRSINTRLKSFHSITCSTLIWKMPLTTSIPAISLDHKYLSSLSDFGN